MNKLLFVVIIAMLAWYYQDQIPDKFRFWETNQSVIVVQNNSDRAITNVEVQVWSKAHQVGTLNPGEIKTVKTLKLGEFTPAAISFQYGGDKISQQAAVLNPENGYAVTLVVNFAGVVTAQYVAPGT
jgi:hypothetical protein